MQGFEIVDLIFLVLECTMSIFKVLNVLPCFPFLFENTEIIDLIDGELCAKCASAVISPLSILFGFLR